MKFIFTLSFTLFFFATATYAQMSEKKKQKFDKKNLEYYQRVFNDQAPFEIKSAPEKWKDESAVILAQYNYISYNNTSQGLSRKRILLQDDNGVKKYSEFYFQESETNVVTLIKKNGNENFIDLSEAIEVTTDVPSLYRDRFQNKRYFKLAIPNLEVGDILDFTSVFEINDQINLSAELLAEEVPILYQKLIIDVDNYFSTYYNTYNTNIKMKCIKGKGKDKKGYVDDHFNSYVLEARDLDAIKIEKWSNVLNEHPMLKFFVKAQDRRPGKNNDKTIENDSNQLVSVILRNKVSEEVGEFTNHEAMYYKAKHHEKIDDAQSVAMAYYVMRKLSYDFLYADDAIDMHRTYGRTYDQIYREYNYNVGIIDLLIPMIRILSRNKVEPMLAVVIPAYVGDKEKLVSRSDYSFAIYDPAGQKMYWPMNKDRNHMDIPYQFNDGAIAYAQTLEGIKDYLPLKRIEIKGNTIKENNDLTTWDITLNTQDMSVALKKHAVIAGVLKERQNDLIEEFGAYILQDWLDVSSCTKEKDTKRIKNYFLDLEEDKFKKFKIFKKNSDDAQKKKFEEWSKIGDYKIDLKDYKVLATGRTPKHPNLEVEANIVVSDFLKKLGPNLVLDIGMLIESQYKLEEKDKSNRKADIYFGYTRSLGYDIKMKIPSGFKIESLDHLNKSVQHPFCSFESKATIVGDELIINTRKNYIESSVSKNEWPRVVEFLEAAYEFSQQKLVLKKG